MRPVMMAILGVVILAKPAVGQDAKDSTAALDSAAAWPWRIVTRVDRLRQQKVMRVLLPADSSDSAALGVACVGRYVNLVIVPSSFAAVEVIAPAGRLTGSVVKVSFRWEDSKLHDADFMSPGGSRLMWHVFHNPFGTDEYDQDPKLAQQLPEHQLFVAQWPTAGGEMADAVWTLPPSTRVVLDAMKKHCHDSNQ